MMPNAQRIKLNLEALALQGCLASINYHHKFSVIYSKEYYSITAMNYIVTALKLTGKVLCVVTRVKNASLGLLTG